MKAAGEIVQIAMTMTLMNETKFTTICQSPRFQPVDNDQMQTNTDGLVELQANQTTEAELPERDDNTQRGCRGQCVKCVE